MFSDDEQRGRRLEFCVWVPIDGDDFRVRHVDGRDGGGRPFRQLLRQIRARQRRQSGRLRKHHRRHLGRHLTLQPRLPHHAILSRIYAFRTAHVQFRLGRRTYR